MSPRRLILLLSALAVMVAACGTSAPSASPSGAICGTAPESAAAASWAGTSSPAPTLTPFLVSNAITCGKARILFLYLDSQNRVASAPDRKATVAFYNLGRDPNKAVGQKAPASKTPTVADVGGDVSKISTDPTPDPAFYQTSVADALAAHKPFMLVFATPKFCQTKTCGPTLDKVKAVAAKHPDVTFINVEPYLLEDVDGQLQPKLDAKGNLQA